MVGAQRKRQLFLVSLAVGGYLIGLPVSRLLDSYRGVVLAQTDARAYVAYLDRMPRWRTLPEGTAGAIVAKRRGAWRAVPVEALGKDTPLMQLYDRYHRAYDGQVVRIDPPEYLGATAVAIVQTDRGEHLRVVLNPPQLVTATIGARLHKEPQTWDPTLGGVP